MSYWAAGIITLLAFASGYMLAIYTLSKRISFDRYVILERLYLALIQYQRASTFEEVEIHGEIIQKVLKVLQGGKVNE